jgi:hypothetical protein
VKEKDKHLKELEELRLTATKQAEEKVKSQFAFELRKIEEEAKEEKSRSHQLEEQILELTKDLRKTRQEASEQKLSLDKKLAEEEDKIRNEARKQAEEEQHLKILEKDKQLQDALKKNDELRQKLSQGSQQTQGEVLEIEIEEILKKEFPQDSIKEVPKGIRGADVVQEVRDKYGRVCGTILWESKNAKWNHNWIQKLKDDQRVAKSDMAVLISVNLPPDISQFAFKGGIWITNKQSFLSLASALRINLYQVFITKLSAESKNERVEVLYNYLTSPEFVHRVESIFETFNSIKKEIDQERRYFTTKWARQEKLLQNAMDQTTGMYGSLQSVTGSALPEIKSFELPSGDTAKNESN